MTSLAKVLWLATSLNQIGGINCYLRYYKYGQSHEVAPVSGKPTYLRDNAVPDVVRLGDINLYDTSDDQYAQQLKIVEIIRHPEHRFSSQYHDLALFRLEKNVTLHDTVAPGCLWNDEEIPFGRMEATGWGTTGFGEAKTPSLLKVSLSVVKKSECDKLYPAGNRGLRQGLQEYQLCAGDIKMDTCPGDSGGPLQVKLLSNHRLTPFVVGVTSFGGVCGQSIPGVYMKVAPYIPWIRAELLKRNEFVHEWSFKPYACAVKYIHMREYEHDVVLSKTDGTEWLDLSRTHLSVAASSEEIRIRWPSGMVGAPENCYGAIIDEDVVVTLGRCAAFGSVRPSHVVYAGDVENEVIEVYRHPRYRPNSYDNDIAILKVKNRFGMIPECIWREFDLPDPSFYVSARGRYDLNVVTPRLVAPSLRSQITTLSPRADIQNGANCTIPEEYFTGLANGLTREHLCFGNDLFLVPETCELQFGAPLRRKVMRLARSLEHVYALNLFGKDCGFGRSAVATRLGAHLEWMNSVMVPNYTESAVHFFNQDLEEFDHCTAADGSGGLCAHVHRCPKVAYDMKVRRSVVFCNTGSVVCCPYESVKNETGTKTAAIEIDNCENRYRMFHKDIYRDDGGNFYHTVHIGWKMGEKRFNWSCTGTLITKSLVALSAYCLSGQKGASPAVANIGEGNPDVSYNNPVLVRISEVIMHPDYNATSLLHDIGLVRLEQDIVPTPLKYPICLWQNETHTPFSLRRMSLVKGAVQFHENYPKYNSDCQQYQAKYGKENLTPSQLCTEGNTSHLQTLSGGPLVWYKEDSTVSNSSAPHL
uniref:Peptidase S1 domain-containing protein n=1 Tax=Anopheles dirus TaxID=7168 RepID=A0A182MYY2_9DIPT